jgi:hypothetical protein
MLYRQSPLPPLLPFRLTLLLLAALIFCPTTQSTAHAAESNESPFLPIWKLLNREQKQQFISGYLQGWRDAGKVTGIATDHIRENPDQAVKALESIQGIYTLSHLGPDALAKAVDSFYSEPQNKSASLSVAISSSKHYSTQ